MEICKYSICTGCEACRSICPQHAINMVANRKGFMYPEIDAHKCSECGLCKKICPSNIETVSTLPFEQKVFAAWIKNKMIRSQSSSGGIFSAIAKYVLNNGGYVFGAKWTKDLDVIHSCTNTEQNLYEFRGSKYVQSKIGDCFIKAKEILEQNNLVLFSGTPCQIAGLYSYLGKRMYSKLITIDLICHGIPTPLALNKYKQTLLHDKVNDKIIAINFRYKKPGWSLCSVKVDFQNSPSYINNCLLDPYFVLFNKNFFLRESCYNCKYTNTVRQGDITLADFWGYQPKHWKMRNFDSGVSCVIVNTQKGQEIFGQIKHQLTYEERTIEDAIHANKSLKEPYPRPEKYNDFWDDFDNLTLKELYDKYCERTTLVKGYFIKILKIKYRAFIPQSFIDFTKKYRTKR